MRVSTISFTGENAAQIIVATLVSGSRWFEFVPMPGGEYELTVKSEDRSTLVTLVQNFAKTKDFRMLSQEHEPMKTRREVFCAPHRTCGKPDLPECSICHRNAHEIDQSMTTRDGRELNFCHVCVAVKHDEVVKLWSASY